jgi:LysM domain
MTSLLTHLLDDGDHGELGFRADCPVCRGARAAGALPPARGGPVRTTAWTLAGALALGGPAAGAAGALAQAPGGERVTQRGTEGGGAQTVDPGATPIVQGTDDTTGLPSGDDPASGTGDTGPDTPLPAEGPSEGQEGTAAPPPDLSEPDPSEGDVPDPGEAAPPAPAAPAPPAQAPPSPEAPAPSAMPEQAAPVAPPAGAPVAVPTPAPAPAPEQARPAPRQTPLPTPRPAPRPGAPDERPAPRQGGPVPVPAVPPTVAVPAPPAVAVTPSTEPRTRTAPAPRPDDRVYVVQAGDSLWSIARELLGERASDAQVARLVDRLWRLNAERIGTGDPSLIRPGQRLVLPATLRAG